MKISSSKNDQEFKKPTVNASAQDKVKTVAGEEEEGETETEPDTIAVTGEDEEEEVSKPTAAGEEVEEESKPSVNISVENRENLVLIPKIDNEEEKGAKLLDGEDVVDTTYNTSSSTKISQPFVSTSLDGNITDEDENEDQDIEQVTSIPY